MKKLFLMFLISVNLFAMSEMQIQNLQDAYSIGKTTRTSDGLTFENTLAAIMLTESSAGKNLVGDDRFEDGSKKPLHQSSLGTMQMQIKTARYLADKYPQLSWLKLLDDGQLTTQILNSPQFSSMLAGYYLKLNYEVAKKRGYWNPYFKAISRYNGGWNNTTYYKRVMRNMKIIKKLVKEGKIK